MTSYVLSLLTDDESSCACDITPEEKAQIVPVPVRDLQLFGDCELAVLAAPQDQYDAHSKLVRAEYSKLSNDNYLELRLKVNKFLIKINNYEMDKLKKIYKIM